MNINSRIFVTALLVMAAGSAAAPPKHIVVVFEENHSYSQIIGSTAAPYINQLAANGALFTSMYGINHPSQPNYITFYSGSPQGVIDDNVPPAGVPWTTPNLGAELLLKGMTFACYSEGLPSEGSTINRVGYYDRKHNPIVEWQSSTPGTNQYGPTHNKPFTAFPTDFSQLPHFSLVVPDQFNDMHSGSVEEADAWLATHIAPYADWAMNNDSLLIITWDEDNGGERNRIPMIFYGPMVRQGVVSSTWTHHNVLRTIEDMFGTTHAGEAANVRRIVGAMVTDPATVSLSFRQGTGGYTGVVDTRIDSANPGTSYGSDQWLNVAGNGAVQTLIRFDSIIGAQAGQIPPGATIVSAKLLLYTRIAAAEACPTPVSAHRLAVPWSGASTWNSLSGGISTDGVEAAIDPDFTVLPRSIAATSVFDVSDTLQRWASGLETNLGWVLTGALGDDWRTPSSEGSTIGDRPRLDVTYSLSPTCPAIETQPAPASTCLGAGASFSIVASGSSLTYWWRHDGVPIEGTDSPTLTITNATIAEEGLYDCVVSNACDTVVSDAAMLMVCVGDYNCDGGVDGSDVQTFFADWEIGAPAADVNADGGVDGSDVESFYIHWEHGC
ncbi:MAG: DNRLRE domain-containing protein [Planctomycetes bacterium]|nr:DNRLRE domain-containing protein [Planctomycetota bacterium]